MKKLIALLSLALMTAGLTGCNTNPPSYDVVQASYERIPSTLIQDCPVEPPPTKEVYYSLTRWQDKEHLLMTLMTKNIVNISNCNVNKLNLREWDQKQYDLHQAPLIPAPDSRSSNDAGRYSAWYTG